MDFRRKRPNISPEEKRDAARDLLRKALETRQDRLKPLRGYNAETKAMEARVGLPDYDKADHYGARLRREMRDKSYYAMTPQERMGFMSGPDRIAYFDAVREQPLSMSGLREKGELDVYAGLKEERLRELHGPLQDAIAGRKGNESEILMVDNMVLNDLAEDSGLSREDFEAVVKKVTAEAPKATPDGPTAPQSPEFEEIWKRFDQMVDASVAS